MILNAINNIAYIDSANLHNGTRALEWDFDYERFRVWLKEKYNVKQAVLFLGYIPTNNELYQKLKQCGYILVFKTVTYDKAGKAKGNCDADLIVRAMQDLYKNAFTKAILVSSDGDYESLVRVLMAKQKFGTLVSPYETRKCSILLKRLNIKISYIADHSNILKIPEKEKAPDTDRTV